MLQSIEIRNCMQHQPPQVKEDSNVHEAIEQIITHQISGLCVVDQCGKLVGVLSELDCLRAILSATYNESAVGTVSQYMSADVEVADIGEDGQAGHGVITVGRGRSDVEEQIDLRGRETGRAHGLPPETSSPSASLRSTSARSSASASRVSTRVHWKPASRRRPTRQ